MSNSALMAAMPTFVGTYYPRNRYPQVMGIVLLFQVCANAVGATLAGLIYDIALTYTPAFITAVFVALAGLTFAFSARKPGLPQPESR